MDRMNPLDASFLYMENGTTHFHIASCAVFEGPIPAYDDLVALFAAKLPLVPRYRQRVRFVPLDLGRPLWVDDPHFNLEYHLRHTALPTPGDERELERLMGRLMSAELDRTRPLWEAWVVEGLAEGRWALISKVHHCMVDGVAGVDLISLVLDPTRDASPPVEDSWTPEPEPSTLRLTADAVRAMVPTPRGALRAARRLVGGSGQLASQAATVTAGLLAYSPLLRPTARTSLDGPGGAQRRWTTARASLDDVRTIRRAFGGTVNDVVLSVIAGGFRELVIARGEQPADVRLRTLVPVSVREDWAHGIPDNRVSAIFYELPVHIADPVVRLVAVTGELAHLKGSHEPEAGHALTTLAGFVPNAITAPITRWAGRLLVTFPQRNMNTVTTNVPGPPAPLYAAGREMLEYLPFVPIGAGVRIGIAILSYNGQLAFGVTGDFDTAPDIAVLARGIEAAVADLIERARPEHVIDLTESGRPVPVA